MLVASYPIRPSSSSPAVEPAGHPLGAEGRRNPQEEGEGVLEGVRQVLVGEQVQHHLIVHSWVYRPYWSGQRLTEGEVKQKSNARASSISTGGETSWLRSHVTNIT